MKIVRPVHARVGDIVRIIWHHDTLEQLTEMHTAPPDEVWKHRLDQAKAAADLTPKDTP